MLTRERILITGGSGFVGACLAHRLVAQGHDVHLLLRREFRGWRLASLAGRFTCQWGDLRDRNAVRQAVQACQPEVIYHLATNGAYPNQRDRSAILATNLLGTANLLDALEEHDYRAFVHAGSSSEYGHKDEPMRETDRLDPRTDYGVTKAAASLLCLAEAYKGRPVSVVRLFSAYGPWEEPTRLVPYVMGCYFRGERPRVTAGQQPRDFIHVDDVLDLLVQAAHDPAAHGQILHAGTGIQRTVREMIDTITAVCSDGALTPEFGSEPMRAGEPTCWVADIRRTSERMGWKPRYDLRQGIEQMWQWYRETMATSEALPGSSSFQEKPAA